MVATDPSLDQLYDFCQLDTDTSYFATEYRNSLPWDYPNRNGFDPEEPLTAIAKREEKGFYLFSIWLPRRRFVVGWLKQSAWDQILILR